MLRHAPLLCFFFFNDTATTEIYTLSLHDALPISSHHHSDACVVQGVPAVEQGEQRARHPPAFLEDQPDRGAVAKEMLGAGGRSEEHTSELQSRLHLVCRLLLEKKKKKQM